MEFRLEDWNDDNDRFAREQIIERLETVLKEHEENAANTSMEDGPHLREQLALDARLAKEVIAWYRILPPVAQDIVDRPQISQDYDNDVRIHGAWLKIRPQLHNAFVEARQDLYAALDVYEYKCRGRFLACWRFLPKRHDPALAACDPREEAL